MPDFTLKRYQQLLNILIQSGYTFRTFQEYIGTHENKSRTLVLRHDVDKKAENALNMALVEKKMGVRSTFFFRALNGIFDEEIIKNVAEKGHEVGYHYENLSFVAKGLEGRRKKKGERKEKNDLDNLIFKKALENFKENLEILRKLYPVKTICMHGSPFSKWDNRKLWYKYDYRDFGIIGEPYFDVDFVEVLYLTDTGRRWDGRAFNVRDKIEENIENRRKKIEEKKSPSNTNTITNNQYSFHSTFDIIRVAEDGRLPDQVMFNIHPQRWNDRFVPWMWELVSQKVKNVVKKWFFVRK